MKNLIVINQPLLADNNVFSPFALTDVLTEYAGTHHQAFLHFWQLENYFILGMKDTRVTDLASGIKMIQANQYQPVIRNAGGLGVISDAGVLNVSLILPKNDLSIDGGYQIMTDLVKAAFLSKKEIQAKEISDSYCPGKFDLSIDEIKFAGIAQRRVKDGVAVMMYLSVTGDQAARGKLVKQFYQAALGADFGQHGYPPVRPESMENLPKLLADDFSVAEAKERLITCAQKKFEHTATITTLPEFLNDTQQTELFEAKIRSMEQRNLLLKEL